MSSFSNDVFLRYFVHAKFVRTRLRRFLYPVSQQRDRCTFTSVSQASPSSPLYVLAPESYVSWRHLFAIWQHRQVDVADSTASERASVRACARAFTVELFRRKFGTSGLFWTRRCDFRWHSFHRARTQAGRQAGTHARTHARTHACTMTSVIILRELREKLSALDTVRCNVNVEIWPRSSVVFLLACIFTYKNTLTFTRLRRIRDAGRWIVSQRYTHSRQPYLDPYPRPVKTYRYQFYSNSIFLSKIFFFFPCLRQRYWVLTILNINARNYYL